MIQMAPGSATAYRRTTAQYPRLHSGTELDPLTPAERIALTIALLNRGLDLLDGFARMTLTGVARGTVRAQHDPEQERHSLRGN